ncbi:hypothetical protein KJ877_03425 [bacterium]|nr:hypothetical protein [bacterium]MBU1990560.1 hypothetical protein [bacterium]
MEISIYSNTATIKGNIKSIGDFQAIKSAIDALVLKNKSIVLLIPDSLSITSSVIGYLNKLVLKDRVTIDMRVGNESLIDLLNDLNLTSTLNARRLKV